MKTIEKTTKKVAANKTVKNVENKTKQVSAKNKKAPVKTEVKTKVTKPVKKAELKNSSYTRIRAIAEVLKANPNLANKDAITKADKLYTQKTHTPSNLSETTRRFRYAVGILEVFGYRK
jgi:hypothetical protein